jgi:hypothetical protein
MIVPVQGLSQSVGGWVMTQWFVPPVVIPAAIVAVIVALAFYQFFVAA